jgi:hypothetical protein
MPISVTKVSLGQNQEPERDQQQVRAQLMGTTVEVVRALDGLQEKLQEAEQAIDTLTDRVRALEYQLLQREAGD